LPYIGALPIRNITKADIRSMVEKLEVTRINKWRGNSSGGAVSEASGVLRHLRSCFRWALTQDLININPTDGVDDPLGKSERDRELTEDEIIALWQVAETIGYPYGRIVHIAIQERRPFDEMRIPKPGRLTSHMVR
jgi:site-specific recombinase XerD